MPVTWDKPVIQELVDGLTEALAEAPDNETFRGYNLETVLSDVLSFHPETQVKMYLIGVLSEISYGR